MRLQPLIIATALTACTTAWASEVLPDTWVCDDELGRRVLTADDGLDSPAAEGTYSIGIFYYIWHWQHTGFKKDISQLLQEDPDNPAWDSEGAFHWGSKPWLGYYMAGNQYIVAKHMQMLMDAGIDWYFFDCTNGTVYESQVRAVMAEIDRREALGLKAPKLAFMLHSVLSIQIKKVYDYFYSDSSNDHYWYMYDGKPLILCDKSEAPEEYHDKFTFRNCWAWMDFNEGEWSWLEFYPQNVGWVYNSSGRKYYEQISVSAAQHATSKIGKSYTSTGKQPSIDKWGLCEETAQGLYLQEQWKRAQLVKAPVVMITQWNEWCAQRFVIKSTSEYSNVRPGATAKIGESYFVDVYNEEFNRDIEPGANALTRDNHYLLTVSNIRKYKGAHALPVPTHNLPIDIASGNFSQWDDETTEYVDEPGDCEFYYAKAEPEECADRETNDFITAKVTKDATSFYFFVETVDEIIERGTSETLWMSLFINLDQDYSTGWGGYDYAVLDHNGKQYLMRCQGKDYSWQEVAQVDSYYDGNRMMLAVKASDMGLPDTNVDFDFKWADNVSVAEPDVMRFISDGDAAPNGRFNYRYKGASLPVQSGVKGVSSDYALKSLKVTVDGSRALVSFGYTTSNVVVEIFNTLGERIACQEGKNLGAMSFSLPHGLYFARCTGAGGNSSAKFTI
ncbi:MAG: hypothetical protein LIP02_12715 [Bacteroidales bacterium]|nr:hypothetical protein [Bacteroidales bacterium]